MPTLADIYSAADSFKRRLADAAQNPGLAIQQMIGYANDRARALNEQTSQAAQESMDTGQLFGPKSRQLAETLASAYNPVGMTVWHGSPYKFSAFDASKIGTGEGAQAYGHGLYVAENPNVAKEYAKELGTKIVVDGKTLYAKNKIIGTTGNSELDDYLTAALGDVRSARRTIKEHMKDVASTNPQGAKEYKNLLNQLDSLQIHSENTGNLYKIDLPDEHIDKMLDWDKKFDQQHPNVQKAILKYWEDNPGLRYYGDPTKLSGEGIYGSISAASLGPGRSAKVNLNPAREAASMDLRHYGIPGIKYLDQSSRMGQEGTRNFVIFPGNEHLLKITDVNGNPIK
jgi:hypothetical protein